MTHHYFSEVAEGLERTAVTSREYELPFDEGV